MEPLTKEEIDVLWEELQTECPMVSIVPERWSSCIAGVRRSISGTAEYWEWNTTCIMLVLAANDALDIPE